MKYDLRLNGELESEINRLIDMKILGTKSDVLRLLLQQGLYTFFEAVQEQVFNEMMEEPFTGSDNKIYYPMLFDKSLDLLNMAYLRDNEKCRKCGEMGSIRRIDGTNRKSMNNLITLCPKHWDDFRDNKSPSIFKKAFIDWFFTDNSTQETRIRTIIKQYKKV